MTKIRPSVKDVKGNQIIAVTRARTVVTGKRFTSFTGPRDGDAGRLVPGKVEY